MKKLGLLLAVAVLASGSFGAVTEAGFAVFNTGVNLVAGVDQSYTVESNSVSPAQQAVLRTVVPTEWIVNTGTSSWISPVVSGNSLGEVFTYKTTFDLTGFVPSLTQLAGRWSTDNAGLGIFLNGNDLGSTIPFTEAGVRSFEKWTNFSVSNSSYFNSGLNTLEFRVNNGAGGAAGATPGRLVCGSSSSIPQLWRFRCRPHWGWLLSEFRLSVCSVVDFHVDAQRDGRA